MTNKSRLLTVLLAGALLAAVAVKFQQSRVPLDERLVSADDGTRTQALRVYASQSPQLREKAVDAIIARHISSPDARTRQFALYALRKSGLTAPKVIQPMARALADPAPKVQQEAAVGLMEAGDAGLAPLVDALGISDEAGASKVEEILAKASPSVVPLLLPVLTGADATQARRAATALSLLSSPEAVAAARSAEPALTEDLKSKDDGLSAAAAFAVHKIDPASAAPAPVFQRLVRAEDWDKPEVRGWDAARALSEIPAAARTSVPALSQVLVASTDGFAAGRKYRRPYLAGLLEKLDARPHLPSDLVWDVKNRDAAVRYRAVLAIGQSPAGKEALMPGLLAALKDTDRFVAARALWALQQIGFQNVAPLGAAAAQKISAAATRFNDQEVENFRAAVGEPALKAVQAMGGSVGQK